MHGFVLRVAADSVRYASRVNLPALFIILVCALSMCGCAALTPSLPRGYAAADCEAWRCARVAALTSDDGWLTLVGLDWLEVGESTIGSSENCTLRYGHASAAVIGTFTVEGDRVRFRAADGAVCTADGVACLDLVLVADDQGAATVLRNGPLHITLVRRNGALALRVRDNASAVRTGFAGIECFAFDPACIVEARVRAPSSNDVIAITNVSGFIEEQPIAALLDFSLAGCEYTLTATAGSDGRFFVVFSDASNGLTTYGGGRFLDIAPAVNGRTTIDFNRATNPPCAFTAFATCPMPPHANRLACSVLAGEQRVSSHTAP